MSPTEVAPAWIQAWRAFVPSLPARGLEALAQALRNDDSRLLQGATTEPPPLECVRAWPVEGACAVTYTGWQDGLQTVEEAEEFFGRACMECDERLHVPAGCRFFLNWFDETDRDEMRRLLLPEVEAVLAERATIS